jgi:tRNA dimethylallyltransferase
MSSSRGDRPLIAVVGPTGSGKSELALALAEKFGGEIVNCDSLQVYRYFNIGTAKLSLEERRGIPHHLLDIADPDQAFSAGEYARMARVALAEISSRNRLPIVTGGTGLYLRALIDGLFPGPARDEAVRRRLARREARRQGSLHRLLRRFDPEAAGRIHPHDVQKLVRAVEVCLLTRRTLTAEFAGGRDTLDGYRVLKLGLSPPRSALYERLDRRCRRMFEGGLLDEVRRILLLGFSPSVRPLESHGYKQALQFLRRELTLEEAVEQAQRNTRRYAKRQWTWFRREPAMHWLEGFGDESGVREAAFDPVARHLGPTGGHGTSPTSTPGS